MATKLAQGKLDRLGRAREVGHAQDAVAVVLAQVGQDLAVARVEQAQRAAAERLVRLADRDHALHPVEKRRRIALLRLDVDRLVAVDRIHDRRQVEPRRIGAREAAVAVRRPLHRRAHAVAIAEVDVVAHADLVAVVDDRRARQRQQQAVHQLDLAQVVLEQGCQPAADPEVEPHALVGGVEVPEVVALLVGHHLERQLVVVAQEDAPLAVGRDVRGLAQDVGDRMPVLLRDRHVHPRHHREVERHVALVAVAEIGQHVLGPLVGLRQQHPMGKVPVDLGADPLQHRVRLRQVLVVGALALDQVGDRVEAQPVDAHLQPEPQHAQDLDQHPRVVEVEIRLVRVEAVPIVGLGDRIPGPVRGLRVDEDDSRLKIFLIGVAPDIVVAVHRARLGGAGALEPAVLIGGVVDHQLGDHPQATRVRGLDEAPEIPQRAEGWIDVAVLGDVVAVVAQRRGVERQDPDRIDAELLNVVELLHQAREVADAVVVGIEEGFDVQLVDDRILVP